MSDHLSELLKRAAEKVRAMSPEAKAAMFRAQCRSWVIGELMLEDESLSHDEAARRADRALKEMGHD